LGYKDVVQWVYQIAGGEIPSPAAFTEQPLAVRVTFITLFKELLEMKMAWQREYSSRRAVA
jgi:hypothetical protein